MVEERFRTKERKLAQFALDTCKIDKDLKSALSDNNINDKELTGFHAPKKFIRGLSVCMGGARDRIGDVTKIKGLRLQSAAVFHAEFSSLFSVLSEIFEPQTSQQADCPEPETKGKGEGEYPEGWASWNMCPDDQLMTGVDVYFFDKEFRALGIRCKGLRLQEGPAPVKDNVGY